MHGRTDEVRRLGKRELGPHAFEQRMPARIEALVSAEANQNKLTGIVPVLASLLTLNRRVETAYLCNADTIQISKLPGEGNHFCGYRNIQMLLPRENYTIPELQKMIEGAWDRGYNSHGRTETGGIEGTRKHIGTSEAETVFQSLNIPCTAKVFAGKDAWKELLNAVEKYFTDSMPSVPATGVHQTELPPIFLQRPKHSLTIVGIERSLSGKRSLLTFDPGYQPPADLKKGSSARLSKVSAWLILWRYRRDEAYLKRYHAFEILFLDSNK